MKKEGLENLALTGYIDGKRNKEIQQVTYLTGLIKWMAEQGGKR